MKCRRKWRMLSSARTICGHRPLLNSNVQRRLLMRRIIKLEERSYLQEVAQLAVLHHLGFRYTTFPESVRETRH